MTTSRLMIHTVSQIGSGFARCNPGIVSHDERGHEQQLVGHRIEPGAQARLLARPPRDQPVEPVGDARRDEDHERPPEIIVDDEITKAGMSSIRSSVSWFAAVHAVIAARERLDLGDRFDRLRSGDQPGR